MVIWIGPAEDCTEFKNRQLAVEVCSSCVTAADHLPFANALVFNVRETNRGGLAEDLRSLAGPALDHGLAIHLIADSDETQSHIAHVIKSLSLTGRVKASTKPSLFVIAQSVARHEAGPSLNDALEFRGDKLQPNAELLLRRAFCDCKHVIVNRLAGGMTSDVLSVHAVFKDSRSGPRPLPFFAKIGDRPSIEHEYEIYQDYVELFVPFYLRPSLDYQRCVLGYEYAVLVGNFVEYSEPLSDVARRNMAQGAIHSLFDDALRGWRLQATANSSNLLSAMPGFLNPDEIPADRVDAARTYGATRSPIELQTLLNGATALSYLSAPYHGDLHADNVRVRGDDAILIDFQRVRRGPLLADHACLETSLAFNEYPRDTNEGWIKLIDALFSEASFVHAPEPALEPTPGEWIWNAVRQIRTIALANQTSPKEYLQIVVISLLRFSRLPERPADTAIAEERKAYAYVIADRLANAVTSNA